MEKIQDALDEITRKWWFYLLVVLLTFFIPTYTSRPFDPRNTSQVIAAVMANALIYSYPIILPVFKVVPILLVLAIVLWGDKVTRLFDIYVAITILLFALFQNAAVTLEYGLAILTGNVVVYTGIGLLWGWEAIVKRNDFTTFPRSLWKYWVVPVAFLAFWFPMDFVTLQPDFSPLLILTSESGLTGCMMIPVYLAIVILFEPNINRAVIRVTSFVGIVTALLNVLQWFVLNPHVWIGVLHLPLLLISTYVLVLSLKEEASKRQSAEDGTRAISGGSI
jgi:hypothetical protein